MKQPLQVKQISERRVCEAAFTGKHISERRVCEAAFTGKQISEEIAD